MSRITAFKNKIMRLQERNNNMEISNIRLKSYVEKLKKSNKDATCEALKQAAKITELENNISLKTLASRDREIINLKQDIQCMQVEKDSLQYKLDKSTKDLRSANEDIVRLHEYIDLEESRKFKNKVKRLIAG